MKIGDRLYFAPGLTFDQVDIDGRGLPTQFKSRIDGLYLGPAKECAQHGHSFAAGVLLVSCIDALARFRFDRGSVEQRFVTFATKHLPGFSDDGLATRFYEEFRNGLVHEARIKKGGQFSLDSNETVEELEGVLLINPRHLAQEVSMALESFVELLIQDTAQRQRLAMRLKADFSVEFAITTGKMSAG